MLKLHILDTLIFGYCSEIKSLFVQEEEKNMKPMSQGGGGGCSKFLFFGNSPRPTSCRNSRLVVDEDDLMWFKN